MNIFPNAKINLGLQVVGKRADGYHNLNTIFYPIALCDELCIEESPKEAFYQNGLQVDGQKEDNLVYKAYMLLKNDYQLPPLSLTLNKKIPFGAGLGGGSADASFTLKLLNEMFLLGISQDELARKASLLGADCAFFIYNKPLLASGIGDIFSPITLSLNGYYIKVIKPKVFVSTKEAFAGISINSDVVALQDIVAQPIENWKNNLVNDFEASIFPQHPELKAIKESLYKQGALYASMSGSGSAIYGIFGDKPTLENDNPNAYESIWIGELQ